MADLFHTPYVRAVWETLRLRLGVDGRLAIFGAGEHTRWLLSVTRGAPGPRLSVVLDDNPNTGEVAGVPVRRPGDFDISLVDAVLVSSDQWEAQLAARCCELWGDRVPVVRLYEDLPVGPYEKLDDRAEVQRHGAGRALRRGGWNECVVIVSDHPRSREAKLGLALRSAGWRTVLLHRRKPAFDAAAWFDETRSYTHTWQAMRLACGFDPAVCHVTVSGDYRLAEQFVLERPMPVVIDPYDVVAEMYSRAFLAARPALASQVGPERTCLERADGVVSRSGEVECLRDEHGYAVARVLNLPDSCWNRHVEESAPRQPRGGELHVVYAGNISLTRIEDDPFAAFGCWLRMSETLTAQGIFVHLYPSVSCGALREASALEGYRALAARQPRFRLHQPVGADTLTRELEKYDLGIFLYNDLAFPSDAPSVNSPAKMRCCATNKFFDYLDAGLPIVHNAPAGSRMAGFVETHGAGIDLSATMPGQWGDLLRSADLPALRGAASRARATLDVRRNAERLIGFYGQIAAEVADSADRGDRHSAALQEDGHADSRASHRPALV